MTKSYEITGTTPKVTGAGTDRIPRKWLVQDGIAYLMKATNTSGCGFHVPVGKVKVVA